ncbi:MAG: hypothetical protein HOP36_05940 [Methyloglobulus sp.]|nr:hypothetical protein [Methyloglobulus sp.]
MKNIQNDKNKPESGPQSFWEFLDKWMHKLAHEAELTSPVIKFVLIGGVCIYLALVVWRVWLISHALTMFGVDITSILPIDSSTAALIHKGMVVLLLFAPDAIILYVLFNQDAEHWRIWTAVALVCAVGASWWATYEPGLGTHCYVVTPDRGLIEAYADKNGQCGVDRPSGLQMSPITPDILLCMRAMKRGIKPHRLVISAINAVEMFDSGDGHSLYWFHQDSIAGFDFYDGPGFDQATLTPLKPITYQNAEKIRQYIKQRQETERAAAAKKEAKEKATAERKQAQVLREAKRQAKAAEDNRRETEHKAKLAEMEVIKKAEDERKMADQANEAELERQRKLNELNAEKEEELRRQQELAAQRERELALKEEANIHDQINASQQGQPSQYCLNVLRECSGQLYGKVCINVRYVNQLSKCQGSCAENARGQLRDFGFDVNWNSMGMAPGPNACIGYRADLGGNIEGAQCLVRILGPMYRIGACTSDGFPYNVRLI